MAPSFDEVMGNIQSIINVGSTVIPGGNLFLGSKAGQNQQDLVAGAGKGVGSIFGGAADGLSKVLNNNPMLIVGAAVVLLILLK